MTIYIDFDNTIFNTVDFYKDMLSIMNNYGITNSMINEYHELVSDTLFNPMELINYCIKKYHINKKVIDEVNLYFKASFKYQYSDAKEFLKKIKNNENKLILLTYGDYEYQNQKIINSGFMKYFDEIIITEYEKDTIDLDYQNSIFIDDNPSVIKSLLDKSPIHIIRVKRPNNRYSKEKVDNPLIIECTSLNELDEELFKMLVI